MEPEQIICQIKELCASVTEHTYDDILRQGYERLTMLHHMGQNQEQVYQPLADYFKHTEDGIIRDCVGDLLDFVTGWCSLQWHIWSSSDKFD